MPREITELTRDLLKKGISVMGDWETWNTAWHEHESWAFETVGRTCDTCSGHISAGELYSIGERQVCPDAPVPVARHIDRVHVRCYSKDETVEAVLKGQNPVSWAGFTELTAEEKKAIIAKCGITVDEKELTKRVAFGGLQFALMGEFGNKYSLTEKLEKNGGSVVKDPTGTTTHIVLGASGKTQYGQPTGARSKKYKEAKKKYGCQSVDEKWVDEWIAKNKATGESAADAPPPVPEKKEPKPKQVKAAADDAKDEKKAVAPPTRVSKRKAGIAADADADADADAAPAAAAAAADGGAEPAAKKAKTDTEKPTFTAAEVDGADRKALQSWAKQFGVKATGTNDALRTGLKALL